MKYINQDILKMPTVYKNKDPNAIAIVGGGLAGSLMMLNLLLRIAKDPGIQKPVEILAFEKKPDQRSRGIAYREVPRIPNNPSAKPNLNIAAKRVTPFMTQDIPEGFPTFVQYIQSRAKKDPDIIKNVCNPSRALHGDYIEHLIDLAKELAGKKAIVRDGVEENRRIIKIESENGRKKLVCDKGTVYQARKVVLATGFLDALTPKFAQAATQSKRYLNYPYSKESEAFFDKVADKKDSSVLVIGTGLTSMDIAARLIQKGHQGKIVMISRRALTHDPYRETSVADYLATRLKGEPRPERELDFTKKPPAFLRLKTEKDMKKAIIREFKGLLAQGYSSEEIMGYWEKFVPDVCAKFPDSREKIADLLSENSVLFTTLRVGVTPDIGKTIRQAVKDKKIKIISASIQDIRKIKNGLECDYIKTTKGLSLQEARQASADKNTVTERFDYVFSGMGNATDFRTPVVRQLDPLWADLMEKGVSVPHWTKSGVAVSPDFSLIDAQGRMNPDISAIGVPVSGHMTVSKYPYVEKPGSGGRLGPASLNIPCITVSCKHLLDSKYEDMVSPFKRATPANINIPRRPAKTYSRRT